MYRAKSILFFSLSLSLSLSHTHTFRGSLLSIFRILHFLHLHVKFPSLTSIHSLFPGRKTFPNPMSFPVSFTPLPSPF
ncbi:hypothetical protein IE53DRAFT_383754, partial [Violaceomyces palustris]